MKPLKVCAIAALLGLGVLSFFLPLKSYYGLLLFLKSDQQTIERILDLISVDLFTLSFLAVFAPAAALTIRGSRVERSISGIFSVATLASAMLFLANALMRFNLFETDVKMLSGYFLFMTLAVSGCVALWLMAFRQSWLRIRDRRLRLQAV